MVGSPLTGLPGAVQARGSEGRGRPFYRKAACSVSDTLGNDAPRTWPRACSVRAPHGAPSTWQHALDVRIELTRLQQVRTRAHQLLPPRPPPRTHTSCGRIEHIVVRHADLARSLTLFAGMAVVATTSMARARRAVPSISRCVHPSPRAQHHTTASLTTCVRDRSQACGPPHSL